MNAVLEASTRAFELMATRSAFSCSVMSMSEMVDKKLSSLISVMERCDTASRTVGVMSGSASMAALMLDVMPNSSTAPSAATPMAWPTLRMVVCTPPDCAASLSLSAKATTLFVCELEMPLPTPTKKKPMYMPMPTPSSEMEEYMSSSDPAITM